MTDRNPPPDRVLEAARRSLRDAGLRGTTLERIAREAGLSRATLHRHGVTRDAVIDALTERAATAYREAMWPVMTGSGSTRERLELALDTLCAVAEEHLELLVGLSPLNDRIFHEEGEGEVLTRSPFTDPLERLLRDGDAEGSVRTLGPVEGATLLFNLVGQTYLHLRSGHRWSPDRARKATVDVALRGILVRPGEG